MYKESSDVVCKLTAGGYGLMAPLAYPVITEPRDSHAIRGCRFERLILRFPVSAFSWYKFLRYARNFNPMSFSEGVCRYCRETNKSKTLVRLRTR